MTRTGEMSLSLGCERETDIGMAASRHANQTDFESKQIHDEKGKTGRWNMSGLEKIVR